MSRRSVTSEIAMVSDDAKAPRMAVTSFCVMSRCATVPAVVGVEVASATTRLILAPPSALMPPAALISSATSSMPLRELIPNCALAPDSGMITPMLIGLACARAGDNTSGVAHSEAVPARNGRRLRPAEFDDFLDMSVPSGVTAFTAPPANRHKRLDRAAAGGTVLFKLLP